MSNGGHVESQENKKLCFCTASLALNSRLGEACRAKTKLFILTRLNMTPRDKGLFERLLALGGRNLKNLICRGTAGTECSKFQDSGSFNWLERTRLFADTKLNDSR